MGHTARKQFDALDQEARVARALHSAGDYEIRPHDGSYIVDGPRGAYIVSETSCSCDDWLHRCSKVGAKCKHQVLVGHWLIANGTGYLTPEPREEGHCRNCGVVEPVEVLVALNDLGAYVCRDCYTKPAPCPKAGEQSHLGWYCPACLRDQPPVSLDDTPGPCSPADLAPPVRLTVAEEAHLAGMDAMFDRIFGEG